MLGREPGKYSLLCFGARSELHKFCSRLEDSNGWGNLIRNLKVWDSSPRALIASLLGPLPSNSGPRGEGVINHKSRLERGKARTKEKEIESFPHRVAAHAFDAPVAGRTVRHPAMNPIPLAFLPSR